MSIMSKVGHDQDGNVIKRLCPNICPALPRNTKDWKPMFKGRFTLLYPTQDPNYLQYYSLEAAKVDYWQRWMEWNKPNTWADTIENAAVFECYNDEFPDYDRQTKKFHLYIGEVQYFQPLVGQQLRHVKRRCKEIEALLDEQTKYSWVNNGWSQHREDKWKILYEQVPEYRDAAQFLMDYGWRYYYTDIHWKNWRNVDGVPTPVDCWKGIEFNDVY